MVDQYDSNPVGLLGTVKCQPWFYKDKVLLIGDAAHAIVPFYGQVNDLNLISREWIADLKIVFTLINV